MLESKLPQANISEAIPKGIHWLIGLQNSDGGWPTFCRGWGKLPFDKSSPDITAHALRALKSFDPNGKNPACVRAIKLGFEYVTKNQRPDGSWVPLWFGNQLAKDAQNPVFGTSRVMLALADSLAAENGLRYLTNAQNSDGGWGGDVGVKSSIEETALAVIALTKYSGRADAKKAVALGALFLIECVENRSWQKPSPIGLYFASLWYSEDMYPVSWTVEALGRALISD
ncbi:MAG: hypothetical protein NT018_06585 [Armatimonadetes bacterium]|nr:hypothetical protein [Armatimonadota bacterium]